MDPLFKAETSNSMDSFRILAKMVYGTRAGWLRILIWIFAVLIIASGVATIVIAGFSASALVVILLGLFLPLLNARMVRRLAKVMARSAGQNGQLSYSFYETSFSLSDRAGESETLYAGVEKVIETEKYYYLFLQNNLCHCILKGSFTLGSENEFLPFLRQKCQKNTLFGHFPGKYK